MRKKINLIRISCPPSPTYSFLNINKMSLDGKDSLRFFFYLFFTLSVASLLVTVVVTSVVTVVTPLWSSLPPVLLLVVVVVFFTTFFTFFTFVSAAAVDMMRMKMLLLNYSLTAASRMNIRVVNAGDFKLGKYIQSEEVCTVSEYYTRISI